MASHGFCMELQVGRRLAGAVYQMMDTESTLRKILCREAGVAKGSLRDPLARPILENFQRGTPYLLFALVFPLHFCSCISGGCQTITLEHEKNWRLLAFLLYPVSCLQDFLLAAVLCYHSSAV